MLRLATLDDLPALLAIEQKYFSRNRKHWGEMGRIEDNSSPMPAE